MRLRYLWLPDLPPMRDLEVVFGRESVLGRRCTIRFIVGVNGSGKSRLLQAVTEIFLQLEAGELPPYPVVMAYDLVREGREQTVFLSHPTGERVDARLVPFRTSLRPLRASEWRELESVQWDAEVYPFGLTRTDIEGKVFTGEELRSAASPFVPSVIVTYTSGATEGWERLFAPRFREVELRLDEATTWERPARWTPLDEAEWALSRQDEAEGEGETLTPDQWEALREAYNVSPQGAIFVAPGHLKLAACAATLRHEVEEYPIRENEDQFVEKIAESLRAQLPMAGFRGLLNMVDWLWPVTIGLRLRYDLENPPAVHWSMIETLAKAATSVIRESPLSDRRLFLFDLRAPVRNLPYATTGEALLELLGGDGSARAFHFFQRLYRWQEEGLLEDVMVTLRKRSVPELLLYDWLSDGERVFLGRMGLISLMRGQDNALVLLDEPETHFNDVWKRAVVDIIDDYLGADQSDILIATHSSIALTDVFDSEITLLRKQPDGSIEYRRTPIHTFGALPSEIMEWVFEAPNSVGKRASEFLDLILLLATRPEAVAAVWSLRENDGALESVALRELETLVERAPYRQGREEGFREHLLQVLRALRDYTRTHLSKEEVSVIEALEVLRERLGTGYHQFEFMRRTTDR